jgi:hypothetical protein
MCPIEYPCNIPLLSETRRWLTLAGIASSNSGGHPSSCLDQLDHEFQRQRRRLLISTIQRRAVRYELGFSIRH